jgi:hypothetical protein
MNLAAAPPKVDLNELVRLCASDGELFCRTFFKSAFRQSSPAFHREIWRDWRNPDVSLGRRLPRRRHRLRCSGAYVA